MDRAQVSVNALAREHATQSDADLRGCAGRRIGAEPNTPQPDAGIPQARFTRRTS